MGAKPEGWSASRADEIRQRGQTVPLPPVPSPATPLIALAQTVGLCASNGMGLQPISFAEIAAAAPWSDAAEREVVRAMSVAYLDGRAIGQDVFGVPPWEAD